MKKSHSGYSLAKDKRSVTPLIVLEKHKGQIKKTQQVHEQHISPPHQQHGKNMRKMKIELNKYV